MGRAIVKLIKRPKYLLAFLKGYMFYHATKRSNFIRGSKTRRD